MKRQWLWFWGITVTFAMISVGLTLWSTSRYGIGLSPDSLNYISLAHDISQNGFAFLREDKAVQQPPFFSCVLAALSWLPGGNLFRAARVLNVMAAAGLVVTIMLSMRRVTLSTPVLLAGAILTTFSVPLTHVLAMAWTEPLFILLTCLLFLLITRAQSALTTSFLAGLLTALACLTRYAGVVLIPVVSLFLLFFRAGGVMPRFKHVIAYAIVPCTLVGLYLLRNQMVSGTLLGPRGVSRMSLSANVHRVAVIVVSWFLPVEIRPYALTMLGLCCGLFVLWWFSRARLARAIRTENPILLLNVVFTLAYTVFIVWTSTTTALDSMNIRLLAPIYPSLLIIVAVCLKPELWMGVRNTVSLLRWLCLFTVFTLIPSVMFSRVKEQSLDGAGGYSTTAWHTSALVSYFAHGGPSEACGVFSNAPDALGLLANMKASLSPERCMYKAGKATAVAVNNLFEMYPALNGSQLAWFDEMQADRLLTPEELGTMCAVDLIKTYPDGRLYTVSRSSTRGDK